jgi:hypothetical protein
MADVTRLSHGASNLPHCSLSHDSFLSSTSASLVRGSFRFRPFSPLRLADAGVMSGNLRPRLASSSSSSPFRMVTVSARWNRSGGRGDVRNRARQAICLLRIVAAAAMATATRAIRNLPQLKKARSTS